MFPFWCDVMVCLWTTNYQLTNCLFEDKIDPLSPISAIPTKPNAPEWIPCIHQIKMISMFLTVPILLSLEKKMYFFRHFPDTGGDHGVHWHCGGAVLGYEGEVSLDVQDTDSTQYSSGGMCQEESVETHTGMSWGAGSTGSTRSGGTVIVAAKNLVIPGPSPKSQIVNLWLNSPSTI